MKPIVYLGHPGHELRIFGWLRQQQPKVWAITDGSGSEATSRVHLSGRVLEAAGIAVDDHFGQLSDKAFYAHVLSGEVAFFAQQVDALAQEIITTSRDTVVSDADEGYSTTHDLCHIIASAAALRATALTGRKIRHLDFPLIGDPRGDPTQLTEAAVVEVLDEAGLKLKIQIALNYARGASPALLKEVEDTLSQFGASAFVQEKLFVANPASYATRFDAKPYYETYGESRAKTGHYDQIIRYREHMIPLAEKLYAFATR